MGRLLMDAELIDKCLDLYCKSGLTKKSYKTDLMKIKKYLDEKKISLDELKHEDIKLFFNKYEKKYATESVNRCKNAWSFFCNYLLMNDYLDDKAKKLISDLDRKIPDNKQEKYLNKNEIEMFLNFLKTAPRQRGEVKASFFYLRIRDTLLFTLLIHRGLRATECSRIIIPYIDIKNKKINIPGEVRKNGGTKYQKNLTVILDKTLIDLYEKYIIERNKISTDNNYLFVKKNGNPLFSYNETDNTYIAGGILTEILRKRLKQFNMYNMIVNPSIKPIDETLSIHTMRHTCSYYLQTQGLFSLPEISSILGQRSLKSTNRYQHLSEKDIEEKLNSII